LRGALAGVKADDGIYSPFKMGLQSYSLRGLVREGRPDLRLALDATKELGLHYWESYTAHVPMKSDPESVAEVKKVLAGAGVSVSGYGVVRLTGDEAANRRYFEFAKAMGLEYLSADPDPAAFDVLDKLVAEFDIAIGIHNHGPGHRYAQIATIAKAIEGHHAKIGCCIDTGHFLRSKEDPVDAVAAFGNRVYGVHLKDVKDAQTFTVLGQGDLRTVDLLKALARNKYNYCLAIEYEEKPTSPLDDIKACLAEAARAIAEVRKG
jgi:inosose dehydratase